MSLYDELLEKANGIEYSNYFMMLCPFPHNGRLEEHPSMMVHDDGIYKCLGCGKFGKDLRVLLRKIDKNYDSSPIKSQWTVLPKWHKWEDKYGSIRGIAERAHKSLEWFPERRAFFKRRKIAHFIEQGMFGSLEGWYLFPILNPEGKVIDIVVRAGAGKKNAPRYVLHPDNDRESPYLYVPNWHRLYGATKVYVPFGMIDAWSFEDIDIAAVTGTAGKSIPPTRLKELAEQLGVEFIFVPDKGEEKEAYHLANKLGWRADVKVLRYPEGTKDPDEIRVKLGKEKLEEMING